MEVFGQYELLNLIHDGEVRTFSAREVQSGRMLLVHKLAPQSTIFERVRHLTPADLGLLVSAGELKGCRYLATYNLPALRDLEQFVRDRVGPEPEAIPQPREQKSDASNQTDAFARLFGEAAQPAVESSELAGMFDSPTGSAPAPKSAPSPPSNEPGEFTRMFQAPAPPAPALRESVTTQLGAEARKDTGEFTQFFRVPAPPKTVDPLPRAPAPDLSQQGEATRIFHAPQVPEPTLEREAKGEAEVSTRSGDATRIFQPGPVLPPASRPAAAGDAGDSTKLFWSLPAQADPESDAATAAPPPQNAGEFTRMFRAPLSSPPTSNLAQVPPQAPPSDEGEVTKVFRPPPSSAAAPDAVSSKAQTQSNETGEFTRMFRSPPTSPGSPEAVEAKPQPPLSDVGEFTKIFRQSPTPPPIAQPNAATDPVPPNRPGEFTKIFSPPSTAPANPRSAQDRFPSSPGDAGEFTKFFNPSAPPAHSGQGPRKPMSGGFEPGAFTRFVNAEEPSARLLDDPEPLPDTVRPPDRDPSEFTRMFGRPSDRESEERLSPVGPDPGAGATGIFARPEPRHPAPGPASSPAKGDYTRMFEAPAASPQVNAPPSSTPAAPPVAKVQARSYVPLIVILTILALAAIALILYFIPKK